MNTNTNKKIVGMTSETIRNNTTLWMIIGQWGGRIEVLFQSLNCAECEEYAWSHGYNINYIYWATYSDLAHKGVFSA